MISERKKMKKVISKKICIVLLVFMTVFLPAVKDGKNAGAATIGTISLPGLVEGCVYNDANHNGMADPGDNTLSGWKVQLATCPYSPMATGASTFIDANSIYTTPPAGMVGYCSVISTVTTGKDGCYTFSNLSSTNSRDYAINIVPQSGWTQTFPASGKSYYLNVPAGQGLSDVNLLEYQGSVSAGSDKYGNASNVTSIFATVLPNTVDHVNKGATNVQLVAAKLTNTGSEDLALSEVHFGGYFSTSYLVNPALYLGDAKIGSPSSVAADSITFSGLSQKIAKGQSITLYVKGDITNTNSLKVMNYSLSFSTVFDSVVATGMASGNKAMVNINNSYPGIYINQTVSPTPSSSWYNTDWGYRKTITISNNVAKNLTAYQVQLAIDTKSLIAAGKMRSDCSDIRFTQADNSTLVPYWIEGGCNTSSTYIWIKTDLAASASKKIYMYYNDSSAKSVSNGKSVFDAFSDVNSPGDWKGIPMKSSGSELHTTISGIQASTLPMSLSYPWIIETRARRTDSVHNSNIYFIAGNASGSSLPTLRNMQAGCDVGSTSLEYYDNGTHNNTSFYGSYASGTDYIHKFVEVAPDNYNYYVYSASRSLLGSATGIKHAGYFGSADTVTGFQVASGSSTWASDIYVDWVFARKYADKEPSFSSGSEESSPYPHTASNYSDTCNPNSNSIKDGAMIRTKGDIDVYIIKYKGCKKFKRIILSPSVFRSYGHLKWKDIVDVDQTTLDSYTTSNHVSVAGDGRIWMLTPMGDTGKKTDVSSASDYDKDSVYEINATDRDSYK